MPAYTWKGKTRQGTVTSGVMEAVNAEAVEAQLRGQMLTPIKVKAKPKDISEYVGFLKQKIKTKDLVIFTRQFATMIDAGLPLVRALRTLEKQTKDPIQHRIVGELGDGVENGMQLSEAMNTHPKSFDKLFVNMIKAGEASGALEEVLNRLAEFMEKAERLKGKIKAAMVYPVVVIVVALLITTMLMVFVVPKFTKIFGDMMPGSTLPMLTRFVVGISTFMIDYWFVGVAMMLLTFFSIKMVGSTQAGAFFFDTLKIKLPPFGDLVTKANVARFCQTLSTLMTSGVTVLNALQIVRDTAGNEVVARAIQTVHDSVKEGEGLAIPLGSTKVFPDIAVSMIQVGEETGSLPEMLGRVARVYEEEVDTAVDGLTSLIEPMMIVFLGLIVGCIVIAMALPLIKVLGMMSTG
jgi:type IV pilus assembly protein PilC